MAAATATATATKRVRMDHESTVTTSTRGGDVGKWHGLLARLPSSLQSHVASYSDLASHVSLSRASRALHAITLLPHSSPAAVTVWKLPPPGDEKRGGMQASVSSLWR